MKLFLTIILIALTHICQAQKGYLITENDSLLKGYLKYQRNYLNGRPEIELWKTKKDKNPKRYAMVDIQEYGTKKDTFRVVTEFYPFKEESTYIPYIELKLLSRGKVNLFVTNELNGRTWSAPGAGGSMMSYQSRQKTYILEDRFGEIIAIDRENMAEDLSYFLDYNKYARKLTSVPFKYKQIPELIKLFNKEE
ncbi:MAG: hypothetical protein AAF620_11080 [Bacteroidota bacterium]